jgi:enoyl-[acyl-carrier protein] reductase I
MYPIDLSGRHALVMGVANHRSLSWAIAQCLHQAGAKLALTYPGERLKSLVEELASTLVGVQVLECDVTRDDQVDALSRRLAETWGSVEILLHGVAFAPKEALEGKFTATTRANYQTALDISAYSLINVTNRLLPLLEKHGASIATLTYLASVRAVPSYNVMGTAKAALEQIVRQLAFELGPKNIRVNALSAGPVSTLAARGIHGFTSMLKAHAEKAPLQRNITKEEVGKAGLFLLSDLSSGITGETLYVDAGYHIMGW